MLASLRLPTLGGGCAVRALSASPVSVRSGRGGRSSTSGLTVTVFGATGRMGRYLVNSLGQTGTQLIIPFRCDPLRAQYLRVSSDLGQQHQIYTPDFNDEAHLENLVKYSDVVVNLTGSHKRKLHFDMHASNVSLTHRIARACKNVEVPCFIHMSSLSADPDSQCLFYRTKALSEQVVLHELPNSAIIVRAADTFHAFDIMTHYLARINARKRLIQKGRTLIYKEGKATYKAPVYGPDVTRAITNIIMMNDQDRQRLYQFAGPKTYSLNELMESITHLTQRSYKPVHRLIPSEILSRVVKSEDFIRYQMTSDTPTAGLPGLEDVGVVPTHFEDKAMLWLRSYRVFWQTWDPIDGRKSDIYNNTLGTGEFI